MCKIRKIKYYLWYFKYPLLMLLMGFALCLWGCSTVKEIPVQTVEKIVYKDTTIFFRDTVTIEVPKEVVKEIVPQDTTSILRTSVAFSEAKIDKGMLHHKLEQNGAIPVQIDTVITVQYVDKIIEKEVPVKVEVIKHKRDNIFWFSIIFNILIVLIIILKIYLKFKL